MPHKGGDDPTEMAGSLVYQIPRGMWGTESAGSFCTDKLVMTNSGLAIPGRPGYEQASIFNSNGLVAQYWPAGRWCRARLGLEGEILNRPARVIVRYRTILNGEGRDP